MNRIMYYIGRFSEFGIFVVLGVWILPGIIKGVNKPIVNTAVIVVTIVYVLSIVCHMVYMAIWCIRYEKDKRNK